MGRISKKIVDAHPFRPRPWAYVDHKHYDEYLPLDYPEKVIINTNVEFAGTVEGIPGGGGGPITTGDITDLATYTGFDSRYYTEAEVDTLLASLPSPAHTHDDRYYTETEVNTLLSGKAAVVHTHDDRYYTETEADLLLAGKAAAVHAHDDLYYTEAEVDAFLAGKSPTAHTHNDLYYTEAEIDTFLSAKAASVHTHVKSSISDFTESDYVHTTGTESVSGVKKFQNSVVINDQDKGGGYALSVQDATPGSWIEILNLNSTGAGSAGAFFGLSSDSFQLWNYQGGNVKFFTGPTPSSGIERVRIDNDGKFNVLGNQHTAGHLSVGANASSIESSKVFKVQENHVLTSSGNAYGIVSQGSISGDISTGNALYAALQGDVTFSGTESGGSWRVYGYNGTCILSAGCQATEAIGMYAASLQFGGAADLSVGIRTLVSGGVTVRGAEIQANGQGNTTTATGIYVPQVAGGADNYGIHLAGINAGADIVFGNTPAAKMYFTGGNLQLETLTADDNIRLGNFEFDADQSVTDTEDGYALTYNHANAQIELTELPLTPPAGSNRTLQYNNNGVFGSMGEWTYNNPGFAGQVTGVVSIAQSVLNITNTNDGSGGTPIGVSGNANSTSLISGGIGVYGHSSGGEGVGVLGFALNPIGSGVGVEAFSSGESGRAVSASALSSSGTNYGVHSTAASADGHAGYFKNTSGDDTEVYLSSNTDLIRALAAAVEVFKVTDAGVVTANKIDVPVNTTTQTGATYTCVIGDSEEMVMMDRATANDVIIPSNAAVAYPVGTKLHFMQLGVGATTVTINTDTLNVNSSLTTVLNGQYSVATAVKITSTSWVLYGDLTPV